jgi:hypothetical protein
MLPFQPIQLADNLIEIINQVVERTTPNERLTVKMRQLLTRATLSCLERKRPRIDAIRDFMATWPKGSDTQTIDGIVNRLELLIQDPRMKKMISSEEAFDIEKLTQSKDAFILDCQGMGTDKKIFTGTLITHSVKAYYTYTRKKEYQPIAIYVDEAHNFVNDNWFDLLKESRKFRVSVMLCSQDFATIPEQLARVMLSNCGTLIAFKCGYREAQLMSREFQTLDQEQIQFLPKYHAAYRTPEGEGIVKTSRPPLVKERPLTQPKPKPSGWFELRPTVQEA